MASKKRTTIIISGMAASGKSTLAESLSKHYNMRLFVGSDALRELARKQGYNPQGVDWWDTSEGMNFLKQRAINHSFDKKVDDIMMEKAKSGNHILTSWTLPYLKSPGIKIWLEADKESRVKRMSKRDKITPDEARKVIDERDEKNTKLYKSIYCFTIGEKVDKYCDIVIDTDKMDEKQVFEKVVKIIDSKYSV